MNRKITIVTKSQIEIALRLLEEQKDINYIIQVTGLTESEITKLKLFGTINNTCTLWLQDLILKLNLTTPPEDLEQLHFLTKNTKPNSTLDTSTNHIAIYRKNESKSITTKATTKTNKTKSTHNIVVDQQALIAEKIEKRRLEFNEILEFLQTHYPNCFNKKRKLLAIGVHKELLKLHSDIFSKAKLSRFFAKYCRSTRYKNRLVVGAIRLNLDGSDSLQVTESEIAYLNKSLYSQQQAKKK